MREKKPVGRNLILLRGKIENFRRSRRSHDFVLDQLAQYKVGATAIGTAVMDSAAAGIGLTDMAMNSSEEADWVEFELDGKAIKGWMWLMPMRKGDDVEVVAERVADGNYVAYSVQRLSDGIVAVYPNVFCGRYRYRKMIAKYISLLGLFAYALPALSIIYSAVSEKFDMAEVAIFLGCGLIGFSLILWLIFFRVQRKMMIFALLAEDIFEAFGWNGVEQIDLRATSRINRGENKLPNFGRYYFRYKSPDRLN